MPQDAATEVSSIFHESKLTGSIRHMTVNIALFRDSVHNNCGRILSWLAKPK